MAPSAAKNGCSRPPHERAGELCVEVDSSRRRRRAECRRETRCPAGVAAARGSGRHRPARSTLRGTAPRPPSSPIATSVSNTALAMLRPAPVSAAAVGFRPPASASRCHAQRAAGDRLEFLLDDLLHDLVRRSVVADRGSIRAGDDRLRLGRLDGRWLRSRRLRGPHRRCHRTRQ